MKLTDRLEYSAASPTDLIHIVVTADTSQNPAGSSYKVPLSKIKTLINPYQYISSGSTFGTNVYPMITNNGSSIDATGDYSFAEGRDTIASGMASHAEGRDTIASGIASHSEGSGTIASGAHSHSEGKETYATGYSSHAEGVSTIASGDYTHSGGIDTIASGSASFVHGSGSTASAENTIVLGADITGTTKNTTFVESLSLYKVRDYLNDAAADADTTLAHGALYTTSGSTGRIIYRKP